MSRLEWIKKIIMIAFAFFYDSLQIHIGTILYQIVYSFCVDLFANMHVYSAHLWVNALIMILGIILFAMGTGIYAAASLGCGSYEALTFSLADKNGWQVKVVRIIFDIMMVVIGIILGGKFMSEWNAALYDNKHESILDFGCGTGILTVHLKKLAEVVIGVDSSESMIKRAQQQYPDIKFIVSDALALPFVEQFDVELAAYEKGLGKLYQNLPKYVHGGDASDKSSNI